MIAYVVTYENNKEKGNDLTQGGELPTQWLLRARSFTDKKGKQPYKKVVLLNAFQVDIKREQFDSYYENINDLEL